MMKTTTKRKNSIKHIQIEAYRTHCTVWVFKDRYIRFYRPSRSSFIRTQRVQLKLYDQCNEPVEASGDNRRLSPGASASAATEV